MCSKTFYLMCSISLDLVCYLQFFERSVWRIIWIWKTGLILSSKQKAKRSLDSQNYSFVFAVEEVYILIALLRNAVQTGPEAVPPFLIKEKKKKEKPLLNQMWHFSKTPWEKY